ncbi:MAG: hypothetical protein U0905_18555 [Pirellulales bacterium]
MTSQVADGLLGKVTASPSVPREQHGSVRHRSQKPSNPPERAQWDLWLPGLALGNRIKNIAPYKFRWWQNYSSQMGNWESLSRCDSLVLA